MPLFSVIIPTHNRADLLAETLESVFAQTFAGYEVIVVDDGSTDETAQLLGSLRNRVTALEQQNKGPGAARNLGTSVASGEYLVFLDSDDLLFPWTLSVYAEVIRKTGKPCFLAGKPLRFSSVSSLENTGEKKVSCLCFKDYLSSADQWRWWGASSFVVRRNAFDAAGGFTDRRINGEDADLAMRLGISQGFVQITAPYTFAYREHAVSAMKNADATLLGLWHQLHAEQQGQYPGGNSRSPERRQILCRHLRPVSLECLKLRQHKDGWRLYRASFRWHLKSGHWKYLVFFPLKALFS